MKRQLPAVFTVAVLVAALAACSSSKSNSGAGDTTGTSATASGGADSGVTEATAYLATVVAAPTSILVTTPLSRKPDPGKTIIALTNGGPSNVVLDAGIKAGADALGWTVKEINTGATPETTQAAMATAVQLKPDGISISGIPRATIQKQLDAAEKAGIPVSANATTDTPGGALFDTSIADVNQLDAWGKMVAADTVVTSKGQANVAVFDLPVYPILHRFATSYISNLKAWCPKCTVTSVPQQLTDIGTKTPSSVVSTIQRSPKTNWIVFSLGDLSTGVDAALKAANLSDKVKIGGLTGTAQNLAALKTGTEQAWTAYPLGIVGARVIDIFARKFNGDDLSAVQKVQLPTQLITPDNVATADVDAGGFYTGVADFADQFKKLWKVS